MEQRGALLTAVLCYASGDELPEMDGMTNMAFSFIKSRIDRDTAAYLEKIEKRREAGKLGGRPKTKDISQKQEKAKKDTTLLGGIFFGSPCWARTSDIMINSHALCQLSYRGISL